MKARFWTLFALTQLLGFACESTSADLWIRKLGALFLLPATIVLLFAGPKLQNHIMNSTLSEAIATIAFLSINAACWILALYVVRRRAQRKTVKP